MGEVPLYMAAVMVNKNGLPLRERTECEQNLVCRGDLLITIRPLLRTAVGR